MIHHDSDLFYQIYKAINEHNERQTHYLSLISDYFDIYFLNESKTLITSSASSLIMISIYHFLNELHNLHKYL